MCIFAVVIITGTMEESINIESYNEEQTTARAAATNTAYTHALKLWSKATRCQRMDNVTPKHVRTFIAALKKRYGATATGRYNYNLIKALFAAAANEGLISSSPFALVKYPVRKAASATTASGRDKALTAEEVAKMESTPAAPAVRDAFLLSCYTGLRLSDVESLTGANVRTIDGRKCVVKRQQKTGGLVTIPITTNCASIIEGRTAGTGDLLFADLPNRVAIYRELQRWAAAAGVEKHISFHCARHTFATEVYNATNDIAVTAAVGGWANIATPAKYYVKVSTKTIFDAVGKVWE